LQNRDAIAPGTIAMTNAVSVASEEALIQDFLAPLAAGHGAALGLVDDCALIRPEPGSELVVKTDPIAEGVHFFADDAPEDVAWKAVAVNVSDLVAKGATPRFYLMALSFPAAPTKNWMTRFAAGLAAAQTFFGMHLVGGDTDRRPGPLSITLTVIGIIPAGTMVHRYTAKPGDKLFVTGRIGDAGLGLALHRQPTLATQWLLDETAKAYLLGRYLRPEPKFALTEILRQHASSAMDISDGLVRDLGKLSKASGVGLRVRAGDVPISASARKALAAKPELFSTLLTAGDDYEIVVSAAPSRAQLLGRKARAAGVLLTCIGEVRAGHDVVIEDENGQPIIFETTGWDHFARVNP
jgi:thiamine-monophosphate kinase